MSVLNNRDTLEHYLGAVWLTRPKSLASQHNERQGINVCVEAGSDFIAIDYIQLDPNGAYYRKNTLIGTLHSDEFRQYIEKLAGINGQSERNLFRQVCTSYAASGDMGTVAQAMGLSKERVRRILITEGAYTNELVASIAWLYDNGNGKTVSEIAQILKVSPNTVQKNMAYI